MLLLIYKITALLIPISAFGVGFYSLYLNPKSKLIWLWFLTSLSVGLWGVGLFGLLIAQDHDQALFFIRFLQSFSVFIPVFYLHFILTFLHIDRKKTAFFVVPAYILSLIFSVLSWTSNIFVAEAAPMAGFDYWVSGGPLYMIYIVYFAVCVLLTLAFLFLYYYKSDGIIKKQIAYIIVISLIGFISGGTSFLPILFNMYPFGTFITFTYPILVTYSIFKK
ncbi:MAG: histidine kinase N-terminal 7TM domain-containing protein [Candidatus Buchananbacteria bacterium]